MRRRIRASMALFLIFIFSTFGAIQVCAAEDPPHIVLVGDVSGSVARADPSRYTTDALALGVGLAPEGAKVAVLTVNTDIVTESGFEDTGTAEGRSSLIGQVDAISYAGNTNLVAGIARGIEISPTGGRVILIADISEGGLIPYSAAVEQELVARCGQLGDKAAEKNIAVDLIFFREAPEGSALTGALEALSAGSGGQVLHADSPDKLAGCVEQIYFSAYTYQSWPITGINSSAQRQSIPITLPASSARRVRIYVPSSGGIQATYAGVGLESSNRRSYTLIDLSEPEQRGITLSASEGQETTQVYLITEYNLEAVVAVQSQSIQPQESGGEPYQESVITLDIVDRDSGNSILNAETSGSFTPQVVLTAPDDVPTELPVTADTSGRYTATIQPEQFGTYRIEAVLSQNGYQLPTVGTSFEIEDVRGEPKRAWDLTLLAAIIIGALLIMGAVIFAVSRKRRNREYQAAIQTVEEFRFSGRLQVLSVIADGGERARRPFEFNLGRVSREKRLTLAGIFESSAEDCKYPGTEKILFLPGPGGSLVVKNNSAYPVMAAGRTYRNREKLQLYPNQKIRVVFQVDEDELEIYYRPARERIGSNTVSVSMRA